VNAAFLLLVLIQAPASHRVDSLVLAMTLDEKLSLLHGTADPEPAVGLNSAGYMSGVPRLGIPPLRLTDGPAGIRTSTPATALPAPVALAAAFDPELARRYGAVMGSEGLARNQDVLLAPMVNIVRVPQAGRNFESLGEDPFLAGRIVADEVLGIQGAGLIATVKHYAANNFERDRQSVDVHVDDRTLHEIYLPAFEAAVRAGAGAVMCSYNLVNSTHACENHELLSDILRKRFAFGGWVMTDWFAAHDLDALQAGLDQEMPGFNIGPRTSNWFGDSLKAAVQAGRIPQAAVDQAVRRILGEMDRMGILSGQPRARPPIDTLANAALAREVAGAGAVLLKNEGNILPIAGPELAATVVIGPTARTPLVGGGGSARVLPFHTTNALDALQQHASAPVRFIPGIDLDGATIPATAFSNDTAIDFTGAHALPAGASWSWSGTITAPTSGDYDLKLQSRGGRGQVTLSFGADSVRLSTAGFFGNASLLPTADNLVNASVTVRLEAGRAVPIRVSMDGRGGPFAAIARAGGQPMQIRLAWSSPERRRAFIDSAVAAARAAERVILFAYDEGTEGADRASLSLPARQDSLIDAVAGANAHTIVVLNTGSAVVMPWIDRTPAVLQIWYAGEEGGTAAAALLLGDVNPSGKLPVTFPRAAEDAPTSVPARYPGENRVATYDEGTLVGYRWYDARGITPLFPFGHGLSYTTFSYSDLNVRKSGDGFDVHVTVRNSGRRRGAEVAQVYLAPPAKPPVPMVPQQLVGFEKVDLNPGETRDLTIHVGARQLSYWSTQKSAWVVAKGNRPVMVGSSSRDIRLRGAF
jgi:beta-glucosidase